ncbi:MAG: NAD(P)-binding domain-containing protein [Polyangiales bacterium]
MPSDRVCILGAGSSGIVALKTLLEAGIPAVALEKGSGIGGNWRYENDNGMSAAYRSLHINTSKERMAYADFPMPSEYPEYPHHTQVLAYFESYVDHFGIREAIRFETSVERVRRVDDEWEVAFRDSSGQHVERFRAVLVANGHHWKAKLPAFSGHFAGPTVHAHDYRTADPYEGKRVLIVGIGNSAVDIACEVCRVAPWVGVSTRRSAHIFPKYFFGKPVDHFTTPALSKLPLKMQSALVQAMLLVARGRQSDYGVPEPAHGLTAAHPTISDELLHFVGHGRIHIRSDIESLEDDGVRFVDGSREPVDAIIYATGYEMAFPFLDPGAVDVRGNDVRLYHRVVPLDHEGLYFVGLVQPLGAIMPLAEVQSKWIAGLLRGTHRLPSRAAMEKEIARYRASLARRYVGSTRHTIQVDFHPYLAEIEREMRKSAV